MSHTAVEHLARSYGREDADVEPFLAEAPPEARERTRLLGVGDYDRQHERYGRAWVTCLPSTHDSFGMALLESLACGTPAVADKTCVPVRQLQRLNQDLDPQLIPQAACINLRRDGCKALAED